MDRTSIFRIIMSIISLVTNGIGFFGKDFTDASCKRFYMVPNVTAMLSGMAVQGIIFIRTWAISGRSVWVLRFLALLLILDFPVQIFGIVYHRSPHVNNGNCKAKVLVPGDPDWNIVYYIAHLIFDWVACFIASFWLVWGSRMNHTFNLSKFMRKVLRHGILYTAAVSFANLYATFRIEGRILNSL
ncbi:hypothetical protein CPB85DRAFT_942553 [Mucidula mucida]|nr:hypothetical protein CPB85DRAFT_942553 [Mucidula mucida]